MFNIVFNVTFNVMFDVRFKRQCSKMHVLSSAISSFHFLLCPFSDLLLNLLRIIGTGPRSKKGFERRQSVYVTHATNLFPDASNYSRGGKPIPAIWW